MIVSITHEDDIDGIGSQAILYRYLTRVKKYKNSDIKPYFSNYSNFLEILDEILFKEELPEILIITDIGFNDNFNQCFHLFERAKTKNCRICWFDHHLVDEKTQERLISSIDTYINDPKRCATEIVRDHYLPDDNIAKKVAIYAHDRDFGEYKYQEAKNLQDIVEFYKGREFDAQKKELMKKLATGSLEDGWIKQQLSGLKTWKMERRKEAIKNAKIITISNFGEIGISFSRIAGGRIIHALEKKYGKLKAYVGIDQRNNEINLYSDHVDCRAVARSFGGGGHLNRSGFCYSEVFKQDNGALNPSFMDILLARVKSFKLKN